MTLDEVKRLDQNDPLTGKKNQFCLPDGVIYLDGNSLGALPKTARRRASEVVNEQWGEDLIASWNKHDWIDLPIRVGQKIAPLLGAKPDQVIACDSISVNLFKVLGSALKLQKGRHKVLSQRDNFPTDLYMVQGMSSLLGEHACQLVTVAEQDIESALDDSVAVLMLTHVNFRSGKIHDMRRLTQLAHDKGILTIWDLAHSAGALPLELDDCHVDFAVGCGYKYLNGGPGAPAFLYVAQRLLKHIQQPLCGWMGHKSPFAFSHQYQAADGISAFLSGTPSILSLSTLDAALDVFGDVDMRQVREKSVALCDTFEREKSRYPALNALTLQSPKDSDQRGSQLAYAHPQAYAICQALIADGVIPDFRAPDIVRFGFTPLYTSFEDVWLAVEKLNRVVEQRFYTLDQFSQREKVT